jgi:mannobiose 2-epimerase
MNKFLFQLIFILLPLVSCHRSSKVDLQPIANEIEKLLMDNMMPVWYPRVIDTVYGGYLSDFNYKWEMTEQQNKMIVTQARHVWTCSKMRAFIGDSKYLDYARHGYLFLRDFMWDKEYGGFFNLVTREGIPVNEGNNPRYYKNAYGNAFGIYALAAYYNESKDPEVLELAKRAFNWLEYGSHDALHGGYFQFLDQDGTPFKNGMGGIPPKDQNSSIHLMEALTELYTVWPDELVQQRLREMFLLIRDVIVSDRGSLQLYMSENLTPLSFRDSSKEVHKKMYFLDHMSFGHDVETAYLLMEAAEALNIKDEKTPVICKKMVDNAMKYGWDNGTAGVFDAGYFYKGEEEVTILRDTKNWWAQAETLNTLLIMSKLYPDDPLKYCKRFLAQWDFVKKYLVDWEYGGWYPGSIDKEPEAKEAKKAQIWKGNYHSARSLMNCIDLIRHAAS